MWQGGGNEARAQTLRSVGIFLGTYFVWGMAASALSVPLGSRTTGLLIAIGLPVAIYVAIRDRRAQETELPPGSLR